MEQLPKPEDDDVHIFIGEIQPAVPGSKWMLEAEHLKIGYDQVLLELSLRVKKGQKIGIIGDNGAGKSTFLKTVAGIIEPIAGKCTLGNRTVMGYFDQQTASIQSDKSVFQHFHDQFPALTEKEVRQTLAAYLFIGRTAQTRVDRLSGGEKSRLVLAEILYSRPNMLVLDEPTNHMDVQAKETLESAFQAYQGTILFVSHDRYFIRQVADAILVFDGQSVMYYPFGYEHYLKRSRQEKGTSLSALVQAEDQALIAGMRAVPKGEKHRLREIDTEEAYLDWQLRLAREPMDAAKARVERLWEQWQRLQQETEENEWKALIEDLGLGIDIEQSEESCEQSNAREQSEESCKQLNILSQQLETAWAEWTKCCLDWWEVWAHPEEE
jgi:ATP-binding cassette subfamily F protein 3